MVARPMTAPRNPIGYTYDELAALLGCRPDEVRSAMGGHTVGVDEASGDELVYPWDVPRAAREVTARRKIGPPSADSAAAAGRLADGRADALGRLSGPGGAETGR